MVANAQDKLELSQATVLVIDDDPGILALLGEALSGHYRVKIANGADAAWRLLRKQGLPDLILLDFQMPGMSGPEFLSALHNELADSIPVIFITADRTSNTESYCLSLGAADFITKPVHLKVLLHRVEHHLRLGLLHKRLATHNQQLHLQVQKRTLELQQRAEELELEIHRRTQVEAQLRHQARHDGLLDLPNRHQLAEAMQLYQAQGLSFILLMFSIEQFHEINYTLGRQIGDALLQELCHKLRQDRHLTQSFLLLEPASSRQNHWACIDGVNYLGLFTGQTDALNQIALHLQHFLGEGVSYEGRDYCFRGRLGGVNIHPDTPAENLIEHAFVAIEQARKAELSFNWYQADSNPYSRRRLALLAELSQAMSQNQLTLHYQPKVWLHNQQLAGTEALLRWFHPEYGFIPPLEFVTLAETTGAIRDLTHWVIRRAAQDTAQFRAQGINVKVSINISAKNLCDRQLPDFLQQHLSQNALTSQDLLLEVTETAMLQDARLSQEILLKLHDMHFQLSIDDFGTGYSSLAFLTKVAAHELKIDRSFVKDILEQDDCRKIVQATVRLANDLNMVTVAEGIEAADIAQRLLEMGCVLGQGYYFHKPMPVADFCRLFGTPLAS